MEYQVYVENSKSSIPKITRKELKSEKSEAQQRYWDSSGRQRQNYIVVLEESKYMLNTLLESRVYEPLPNNLQLKMRGKYKNSLPNIKRFTLKWTLDKNTAKMWIRLNWLTTGSDERCLWRHQSVFSFHNRKFLSALNNCPLLPLLKASPAVRIQQSFAT